jgi:hypothetical protein
MTSALMIVAGAAIALVFLLSARARSCARTGASQLASIEKKHHVFSGALAVLLALSALAFVAGLLLMWALNAYVDVFKF